MFIAPSITIISIAPTLSVEKLLTFTSSRFSEGFNEKVLSLNVIVPPIKLVCD